ncbi:MAG: glycerol-3-phosphate acyltransferase [Ignavibacteriaceae bacterium]
MLYLFAAIVGYLLGSFPSAYIFLKRAKSIDITQNGTGNVGAMNAYEITNSKYLGLLIFLVDALKGLLSVYLIILFLPLNFVYPSIALLFAVVGHCYSPWISFKGGRGLATSAGGLLLLSPFFVFLWGASWVLFYLVKREIIISNIFATILSMAVIFSFTGFFFRFSFPYPDSYSTLNLFASAIFIIILIKHFEPLQSLITQNEILSRPEGMDSQRDGFPKDKNDYE